MTPEYDIPVDELELIEDYLMDKMSPDQSHTFSEKMRTDSNWRQKIEETKLLMIGIQEAALHKDIVRFHEELMIEKPPLSKNKVFKLNTRWLVAASVLLMASVASWLLLTEKNKFEKLYSSYYNPDPGLITAMGPADNYLFEKGMVNYKTGDYQKAIKDWEPLLAKNQGSDTLHYFIGVANQALGNESISKKHLEYIVKDSANSFYKDACWYLGLLLLKQKETQAALIYIEKSDHPKKAALLDAINKNE